MKLCIDCKFYEANYQNPTYDECHRDVQYDLVRGGSFINRHFCEVERKYESDKTCSPEGLFFIKKESK